MPSARPIAPRPSPRLGCTATPMPVPIGSRVGASAVDQVRDHRADVRRERGLSRRRPRCRRCRPTSRAARPVSATSREQRDRVGVAAAARRPRGTACRDRAGRPGRAARRRPRARPRRRRSGRRGAARPSIRTPPSTSGGASPNGMDVEAEPDPVPHGPAPVSSSACASSRSSATVSLRLRRSPVDDHDGTAVGLDQRGVVGVDRRRRVRGAQRVGAERLRGLHGDQIRRAARSRPRDRRRRASPCRTTGSAGTAASAPAATAAIDRARTAPRRERPGRVVHDHDVGVGGRRARARPAPSPSASHRPARRRTPSGAVHSASAGSTTTTPSHALARDPDGAVEHARAAEAGELLGARRSARRRPPRRRSPRSSTRAHVPPAYAFGRASMRSVVEAGEHEAARVRRHDRRDLQHHLGTADELARRR